MGRNKTNTEHPALALMRHEARGYLLRFQTDLEVHDVAALAIQPHHKAFGWILRTDATFMSFTSVTHRRYRLAESVVEAFGADACRFFFWDGGVLMQHRCAFDLDRRIEEHEEHLRERERAAQLANRGVL